MEARAHGQEVGRADHQEHRGVSKKQPLPRVLNGLGIPFVGERTAQILADTFGRSG